MGFGIRPGSLTPLVETAMKIRKAVITAAGKNQRTLPLQTLVDRDGVSKTALAIIIEEALSAGIEEIGVVVHPGDAGAFGTAAGAHVGRLRFIEQQVPLGYGHAVASAAEFTQGSPFLLLVGDHVYVSSQGTGCARQLVEIAAAEECAVSAVQPTHESKLPFFGAVGGRRLAGRAGLYAIKDVLEKPTPTVAEERLIVPGLRTAHYLCFFGMHVLTPAVMELLQGFMAAEADRKTHLSTALAELARREHYLAAELAGRRYDIGAKYGLLTAQLALGLAGRDREDVLTGLVELLASTR